MTIAKRVLPMVAAIAILSPAYAAPESIAGNWKTDDGKSIIQFYQCGASMCGKIAKFLVAEPAGGARDSENSDKAKRGRRLLGLRIFWNLAADGSKFAGKGYSPEDGRYFNAQVWRTGNVLKVKGCVMVFCKTVNFTKA